MDTEFFREALRELGPKQSTSLTSEQLSRGLRRAQELKEIAAEHPASECGLVSDHVTGHTGQSLTS
jgi:phage FluMu protein gp41